MRHWGVMVLVCVACGADETALEEPSNVEMAAVCDWTHTEGCAPCADRRDYGAGNTCEGVIWRGRSETDFCLQTYPCVYTPVPVTRIEE